MSTKNSHVNEPSDEDEGQPKMYFESVTVTPAVAGLWLDRNHPRNRNGKPTRVTKYARDMAGGHWFQTGDTIKITRNDMMIDGGQRMRAVLRAAAEYPDFKSVEMVFARNVPEVAITVTDNNSSRTFGDILRIQEAINQTQVGAVVRRVHLYEQGNPAFLRGNSAVFTDPTMTELLERYMDDRKQFDAAAARGLDVRGQRIGNATAAGTAYYVLNQISHDLANDFFDRLVSGTHEVETDPIWVLRERLRRGHTRLNRADMLTPTEQLYLIIRTWNAFLGDETLGRLQLPDQRLITNANFPRPMYPHEA